MKIPFTLDAWLKDKSQKVETRDGRIVHNIWPVEPLVVKGKTAEVCALIDGEEDALVFFAGGKYLPENAESPFDLFIVTPEPELSEFEKGLVKFYSTRGEIQPDKDGVFNSHEVDELLHKAASELLSLAREQFVKDGYVIEKKIFHDAVGKVDPGIMKEVSKNVDMTEYEKGRADALKDWPRWKKAKKYIKLGLDDFCFTLDNDGKMSPYWDTEIEKGQYFITEFDLEKLPKED